jgi:hypothetical protein
MIMKSIRKLSAVALALAGSLATFGQGTGLGLNFASTDPDAATSSLLPEELAGVLPQANWNNLTGASGSGVGSLVYDNNGTAVPSSVVISWSAPNTWRSGANNGFPAGSPDQKLTSGYLDTGNAANNGVSITVSNLDSAIIADGYDVYVYFVSDSSADRGGAYIVDDGHGPIVKYGSTMGTPVEYVEDPGTDQNLSQDGNYLRFKQLTGSSFTLKSDTTQTTPNGFRAPVNAIQIVPTPQFGPIVATQPRNVEIYSGHNARFIAAVDGYPLVTSVKWQKNGSDLADGGRISGATTTNLVIENVSAADEGTYTLVAVSPRGTITSDPANLSIVPQENSAYINALLEADPLANWRFNEAQTDTNVYDFISSLTGIVGDENSTRINIDGPRPTEFPGFASDNSAIQFPVLVEVPTPVLNTNTVTFITWINPTFAQLDYTGLFMTRSGTQAGLGYTTDNQLGYTWNNNSTYTWQSGLRPPDNQWSMVALVIETNRATIYLGTGGSISAAINTIPHTAEVWGQAARIGDDAGGANRAFNGIIDEVSVFNRALSFQELASLYGAATGVPQDLPPIISTQPVSTTRFAGSTVNFKTVVASTGPVTYQWKKGSVNVANDAHISGATGDTLVISNVTAADAGDYTLVATNPNGSTTSDAATLVVNAVPNAYVQEMVDLAPASYYRLDETGDPASGTEPVLDLSGGHNGTYGSLAFNASSGIHGPVPSEGFGALETSNGALQPTINLADSWATVPGPGFNTNSVTMLAWINPATRVSNAGIVFARAGQPATGLDLNGTGNLGYTWRDDPNSYNFVSGLVPPLNQWSLVAVAVETNRAVVYMVNANGLQSATNTIAHANRAFTDNIRIGGDPNNNNRTFDGRIDEVAVFDRALNADELNRLFQRALGSVAPSIAASPVSVEEFIGNTFRLNVSAVGTQPLTYRWERKVNGTFQTVANDGNISGADTATLTVSNATSADASEYRVVVGNSLGSATSEVAIVNLAPKPPTPGEGSFGNAVLNSGALSYWRFNEQGSPSTGTLKAYDYAGGRTASYGINSGNASTGIVGPTPVDGFDIFESTNSALGTSASLADSWVTTPALGITTDTLTIVAWINPNTLVNNAGIVFARNGQPATGLNLNGSGNLGYHWMDTNSTYGWNTGITPPVGQWSMVAISVAPTQAVAYLINANGIQTATNNVTHAPRQFTDTLRIGGDPIDVARTFDGAIDEVAIFGTALSGEQIQALYNGEVSAGPAQLEITRSAGQITITWTQGGTPQSTSALQGAATVWTNESTTGNSLTVQADGKAKFYRVVR